MRVTRFVVFALTLSVSLTTWIGAQTPAPPAQAPAAQAPAAQAPAAQTPPQGAPAPGAQPAAPQRPQFKGGIDVVSLNVTVTDGAKSFIRDLDRGEFAVYEDGVKQDLTYFTRDQMPIALSLLIDTSASMEDKIQTAQDAAIGFVKRLRSNDLGQ